VRRGAGNSLSLVSLVICALRKGPSGAPTERRDCYRECCERCQPALITVIRRGKHAANCCVHQKRKENEQRHCSYRIPNACARESDKERKRRDRNGKNWNVDGVDPCEIEQLLLLPCGEKLRIRVRAYLSTVQRTCQVHGANPSPVLARTNCSNVFANADFRCCPG
jgi:hypothetical protein